MINRLLKNELTKKPIISLAGWYFRTNPKTITCREFNDSIFDHIEKDLTAEQVILFERHMRVCPICRNFLKTYIATYKTKDHIDPYEHIPPPTPSV